MKYRPRIITVGGNQYIRENEDPNYYNVNGRMYFERIHIKNFPRDILKQLKKA